MNNNVDKSLFLEKQRFDLAESYSITESYLLVCIDSEYKNHQIYSLQVYLPKYNYKILLLNKQLYEWFPTKISILDKLKEEFEGQKQICDQVIFETFDDLNFLLYKIILKFFEEIKEQYPKQVLLIFYFAINDIFPAFGFKNILNAILRGQTRTQYLDRIYKLRNYKGLITVKEYGPRITFKLYDLYGFNPGNLKATAAAVGVNMASKNKLDRFKNFIAEALLHDDLNTRLAFLEYSMDDAIVLYKIWKERIKHYNGILKDSLNLSSHHLIQSERFPSTIGRFVATAFQQYIYSQAEIQTSVSLFKAALYKIGYLDQDLKNYEKALDERNLTLQTLNPLLIERHCNAFNYSFNGFSLASIEFLNQNSDQSFKKTLANVTGGRCINERYEETRAENVVDIDIKSCYGSTLSKLEYPIGKPFVYACKVNESMITLKSFLKKYRKELIPGLYKIVVNGELNFSQDLVFSKPAQQSRFDQLQTLQALTSNEKTDHVLLKSEIIMGVITSDILEIIEKVSTNKELSGWHNLKVVSAIFYPKTKRVDTIAAWTDKVLASNKKSSEIDSWVSFPLSNFIQPLLQRRLRIKESLKTEKDPEIISDLQAAQNGIKLLVNTLYGVLASKFFEVGNVVVADNVTAKPRAKIWLASKVLGGLQTITDGMLYQPDNIVTLKTNGKRPGFQSLADYYLFRKNKHIQSISLLNREWGVFLRSEEAKSINYNELDLEAEKAINEFWGNYNLQLEYQMEHNPAYTAYNVGYFSKAHYFLNTIHGTEVMKARSFHMYDIEEEDFSSEKKELRFSPMYHFLKNLANGKNTFPSSFEYSRTNLITTNRFKVVYKKDSNTSLRPGDFIREKTSTLKLGPVHLPSNTLQEHKSKENFLIGKNKRSYHERYNLKTPEEMVKDMLKRYVKKA